MIKDFDGWNKVKKRLDSPVSQMPTFRERDIWWCSLGLNIGDEENGKNWRFERPVLILRKFNPNIALVLPLTKTVKYNRFYYVLDANQGSILLSQARLVSARRFSRFMKKITTYEYFTILNQFIEIIKYP